MSAYNKVNGLHCAENALLLRDILDKEFGFKGFVVSDWASTYSTAATVNAGMDLEMPGGAPMRAFSACFSRAVFSIIHTPPEAM